MEKIFNSSHCIQFQLKNEKHCVNVICLALKKLFVSNHFSNAVPLRQLFNQLQYERTSPESLGWNIFIISKLFQCSIFFFLFLFFMNIFICSRFEQSRMWSWNWIFILFFFFVNKRKSITTLTSLYFTVRHSKLPKPTNHWKIIWPNKTHNLLILLLHYSSFCDLQENNHKHDRA